MLDGQVIGQCQRRHTHAEWLTFLKKIDRQTPGEKELHLIVDNDATHKHPKVQAWLAAHPRFHMPFIWTAKANDILQKVIRAKRQLRAKQNEALH